MTDLTNIEPIDEEITSREFKFHKVNIDPDGYVELEIMVFGVIRCYDFHMDEMPFYVQNSDNPLLAEHFDAHSRPLTEGKGK